MSAKVISYWCRWETCAATGRVPNDTGTVAVVDGCEATSSFVWIPLVTSTIASILLTPFRVQNIPPPLSSYQLTLRHSPSVPLRTPCYVTFSPTEDMLAALWETGYVELWDLHTRLEFCRGPVMTPELIRNGPLFQGAIFREIAVSTNAFGDAIARIVVLGSESNRRDVLQVLDIKRETISALEVPSLESLGWRLALTRGAVSLYRNGKVFECTRVPVSCCASNS